MKKPPVTELGRVTTLAGVVEIGKHRRRQLGLSQSAVDDAGGLQSGYTGKLECGDRGLGAGSLPRLLQALKLELAVVPMRTAAAHENKRFGATLYDHFEKKDHHARIGAKGGRATSRNLTPEQRRESARRAARARWRNRACPS